MAINLEWVHKLEAAKVSGDLDKVLDDCFDASIAYGDPDGFKVNLLTFEQTSGKPSPSIEVYYFEDNTYLWHNLATGEIKASVGYAEFIGRRCESYEPDDEQTNKEIDKEIARTDWIESV